MDNPDILSLKVIVEPHHRAPPPSETPYQLSDEETYSWRNA